VSDIWKERPEKHDYPAAQDYLTLVLEEGTARKIVGGAAKGADFAPKGQGSVARQPPWRYCRADNPHVAGRSQRRSREANRSRRFFWLRGDAKMDVPLQVADGYHRICASWYRDEKYSHRLSHRQSAALDCANGVRWRRPPPARR